VTAATNLRALVFTIPLQSRFDVKSIAGNIIPAIATTNAIVAGLQVLQAVKLLQNPDVMASCRFVYCNRSPSGRSKSLLLPVTLDSPSSSYACREPLVAVLLMFHYQAVRDLTIVSVVTSAGPVLSAVLSIRLVSRCTSLWTRLELGCVFLRTLNFLESWRFTQVLKGRLGFNTPSIALENGSGLCSRVS
jgi:hypothetical protein